MRKFISFDYDFKGEYGLEFVTKEFENIFFKNEYCYIFLRIKLINII